MTNSQNLFKEMFTTSRKQTTNLWRSILPVVAAIVAVLLQLTLLFPISKSLAQSNIITVNSNADNITAGDGSCTLREAIINANQNTDNTAGDCVGGNGNDLIDVSGVDRITLSITGFGENNSATGDLDIRGSDVISITSNSHTIIDADGIDKVFHLIDDGTLYLENITVTGGNSIDSPGGGIQTDRSSDNVLILNNVVISGNMTAEDGGGIYAQDAILNNVAIINNHANVDGGGIKRRQNKTVMSLNNVTISGNTAGNNGGGIDQSHSSSSNPDNRALTNFNNVTIYNNTADSDSDGFGDGDGFNLVEGTFNIKNSIIYGNDTQDCLFNDADANNRLNSLGNNIIGNNCNITLDPSDMQDDPFLGPLQAINNTFVNPLLLGSPAIDAADDSTCTDTDQRGQARFNMPLVDPAICDIGAYELVKLIGIVIDDVTRSEGVIPPVMKFTVSLTDTSPITITVKYSTGDNTAVSADGDYQSIVSKTLTFPIGIITQTIAVTINNDTLIEDPEIFFVNLFSPTWSIITDNSGTGTIIDDDGVPKTQIVTITDAGSITEGNPPDTPVAIFDLNLSISSTTPITVFYTTIDGTATGGVDYTSFSDEPIIIPPGSTNVAITIPIIPNIDPQTDRTFSLRLTDAQGAIIGTPSEGKATIIDDDSINGQPTISINDVEINEGNIDTNAVIFEVRLSQTSTTTVTVEYTSSGVTASPGEDYQEIAGTLTFPPGTTVQTVILMVNGDTIAENDETVNIVLSNPTNASLDKAQGTATIIDDDEGVIVEPTPTSKRDDDEDDDDDDDDSHSSSPAVAVGSVGPSVASSTPQAENTIPVSVLPKTGITPPSTILWQPFVLGLVAMSLVWFMRRLQK